MLTRDTLQSSHHRSIRSFVARGGRMNTLHREIISELWPQFGLPLQDTPLNFKDIFGRSAPLSLEIGFGDGRSLLQLAAAHPEQDFIGIEVYKVGIAKLLAGIKEQKLTNIRIFCADALEVLSSCISDASLAQVQLFFPDPWPKARHHKRRIVQPEFVTLVGQKLQPQGTLHMATDWQEYAEHMMLVMENSPGWVNTAGANQYALRPESRPLTKFEQRGHRLGYGTWDLIFRQ